MITLHRFSVNTVSHLNKLSAKSYHRASFALIKLKVLGNNRSTIRVGLQTSIDSLLSSSSQMSYGKHDYLTVYSNLD